MDTIPHGALYQFRYKNRRPLGSCVDLGPIGDRYGYIVSVVNETEAGTLYLIRGTGSVAARVVNGKVHRIIG